MLPQDRIAAAVEPELADRLLIRLFVTLADWADRGEQLQVSAEFASDGARIEVSSGVCRIPTCSIRQWRASARKADFH